MIGNQIIRHASAITEEFISHGRVKITNPEMARILKCIAGFLFGFTVSTAKIFGDRSPFGLGFAAAMSFSMPSIFSYIGIMMGYLISGNITWVTKYFSALLLIVMVTYTFRKNELSEKTWFQPVNAGTITATIGFLYLAEIGITPINILLFIIEAMIAAAGAWSYEMIFMKQTELVDTYDDVRCVTAVLFTVASVLIAFSAVKLFYFISLGRILAALIVLLITFNGRITYGCTSAIIIGISLDAASNISPYFTAIYGFSALVAGAFVQHGKYLFSLSFVFISSAAAVWSYTSMQAIAALCEVLAAALIFIFLPKKLTLSVGALLPSYHAGSGVEKAKDYTKKHIEQTAAAFRELHDIVKEASGNSTNDNDIATVFDRAADKVCRKCPNSVKCWQIDYQNTLNIMNDISTIMMRKGAVVPGDFPEYFSDSCENIDNLADEISREARTMLYRRSYRSRLIEQQDAVYNQYADIASVLKGIANEMAVHGKNEARAEHKLIKYLKSLDISASVAVFRDKGGRLHAEIKGASLYKLRRDREWLDKLSVVLETRLCTPELKNTSDRIELLEAEPLSASVGIASSRKAGQPTSGDRCTYFKTDDGMLYIILSDGMGTGEKAAEYSASAVHILERFLKSGVAPEVAVRILNGLMLLKNETDTVCTTVDLMCISLFSGETKIFKYGAAPSYIKKSSGVSKISSHSFAAGLGSSVDNGPDIIRLKLSPSSIAVITSDGILGNGDDRWIRTFIDEYEGSNPKDLAKAIIRSSFDKFGCDDDMTVLTVFMEERT